MGRPAMRVTVHFIYRKKKGLTEKPSDPILRAKDSMKLFETNKL
jgi:hypothetical protein